METTEYKCLQSQFSVLYNESMQIKTQLEEARSMLATSKNTHLRQIEQMEVRVCVCDVRRAACWPPARTRTCARSSRWRYVCV